MSVVVGQLRAGAVHEQNPLVFIPGGNRGVFVVGHSDQHSGPVDGRTNPAQREASNVWFSGQAACSRGR